MKQHITIEQLNELSEKGKERLKKWWNPKEGDWIYPFNSQTNAYEETELCLSSPAAMFWDMILIKALPLLSIGQMIEFFDERITGDLDLQIWINSVGSSVWTGIGKQEKKYGGGEGIELCDSLWEAVKKEVLEK